MSEDRLFDPSPYGPEPSARPRREEPAPVGVELGVFWVLASGDPPLAHSDRTGAARRDLPVDCGKKIAPLTFSPGQKAPVCPDCARIRGLS